MYGNIEPDETNFTLPKAYLSIFVAEIMRLGESTASEKLTTERHPNMHLIRTDQGYTHSAWRAALVLGEIVNDAPYLVITLKDSASVLRAEIDVNDFILGRVCQLNGEMLKRTTHVE